MNPLTPAADRSLDRYLKQLRLTLRGTSVDVSEIETDVRDHIEQALMDQAHPVSKSDLEGVLKELGSPSQWVPEDEIPYLRRLIHRIQAGPEDWRLAYLCFGLTMLGIVTAPIGGPLLWIPAYFLGRAAVAAAVERDEPLGARRWLVYPPIVLFSLTLTMLLLAGPFVYPAVAGVETGYLDRLVDGALWELPPITHAATVASVMAIAVGFWWLLAAPLSIPLRRSLAALILPLANSYRRGHALALMAAGAVLVVFGAGYLYLS